MLCVLSCYGSFSLTTVAVAALFRRTDNDGTFKFGAHLVPVCATYEKKNIILMFKRQRENLRIFGTKS